MHKLNSYKGQYVFLCTNDGTKLLCKPVSIDEDNIDSYIIDVIEPDGDYERGQIIISDDEVGYVVELPEEVQQGIDLTLKYVPNIIDIQAEMINDLTSRISFGKMKY